MVGSKSHAHKLCTHQALPDFALDNQFIIAGYRRPGGTNQSIDQATARNQASSSSALSNERNLRNRKSNTLTQVTQPSMLFEHNTYARCWESVWLYWHNETINIHSHMWGCVFALLFMLMHVLGHLDLLPAALRPLTHHNILRSHAFLEASPIAKALHLAQDTWAPDEPIDVLAFGVFGIAASLCLGFSATFHCLHAHSDEVSKQYNKLDYIGIVVMIWGSFLPALHYGFKCHPHLQLAYSTFITVLSAFTMYAVVAPIYSTPAYRPARTSLFVALGLSAVFPVAHAWRLYGYDLLSRTMGLHWIIVSGAFYIIGACIYAFRVPERWAPGRFDYIGASHQIFHVFILCAAAAHYVALRRSHFSWHAVTTLDGAEVGQAAVCAVLEQFAATR